jgi:hypothetical protein
MKGNRGGAVNVFRRKAFTQLPTPNGKQALIL